MVWYPGGSFKRSVTVNRYNLYREEEYIFYGKYLILMQQFLEAGIFIFSCKTIILSFKVLGKIPTIHIEL